ncbi:MAG: hypothetical protein HQL76_14525 [Magnetococcales bacterium]|nr:hypothetical protein [Magnetococcales bacterium]
MARRDRPWEDVPPVIGWLALLFLALQCLFHAQLVPPSPRAVSLPAPLAPGLFRLSALGDPMAMNRMAMLWLQGFDYQSGISLSFKSLDPVRLRDWLSAILDLDPRGQYPLMAASRIYADIPREESQRILSRFVFERFFEDPDVRWPWLGHVAIIAKHRLHDLPLALSYARAIRLHASPTSVPSWARQMEMTILEDMGELDQARLFIGGLLSSGQVTDPREIHFLDDRLRALELRTGVSK